MTPRTTIYFVRHAEPDLSIQDDRMRPLTASGIEASKGVAQNLKDRGIEVIYSSPFKRAYDTVKDLANLCQLEISVVEGFRERKVDDVWIEDFKSFSQRQWEDFDYKLEGGECLREVQKRNMESLDLVLDKHIERTIVIGTHGTALSTIINYYQPEFKYEGFRSIVHKMPYILCFKFEHKQFISMIEVEIQSV